LCTSGFPHVVVVSGWNMKLLALAVLFAIIQATPPVPRKATNAPNSSGQNGADHRQSNENPAAPTSVKNTAQPDSNQGKDGIKQTSDNEHAITVSKLPTVSVGKDRWDITYFFLTAALVIVGGATWWAIWIQAKETAKAAKATEQSAAATEANTQAFREAERTWIVEKINFPDHIPRRSEHPFGGVLMVQFTVRNIGKQPAFIRVVQGRFHTKETQLSGEPKYSQSDTTVFSARLLAPDEPMVWQIPLKEVSLDDYQVSRINGEIGLPLYLYAYGRVQYESVGLVGSNQFCYRWHNVMGVSYEGDKTGFRKDGPDEYNKYT
jgi:hypothetical protein